jgi:hypothetical protein
MTLSIDDLTYRDVAKTIDHSLLRPELDDAFVEAGCLLAAEYDVASVCVRPADVARVRGITLTGRLLVLKSAKRAAAREDQNRWKKPKNAGTGHTGYRFHRAPPP